MKHAAALLLVFIITLASYTQRADPPLPPSPINRTDSGVIISGPGATSSNAGQDLYRKKYDELVDSLQLKKEKESRQTAENLSTSYRYAIYGVVAAGIIICALLGIVYRLYQKNKTLNDELNKLRS